MKSSIPYIDELTVFIKVKIEILKEFSKEIPKKVKKHDKNNMEIKKIKTDKKYLLIMRLSKLISKKSCFLFETVFGFTCEIRLSIENLNKM